MLVKSVRKSGCKASLNGACDIFKHWKVTWTQRPKISVMIIITEIQTLSIY